MKRMMVVVIGSPYKRRHVFCNGKDRVGRGERPIRKSISPKEINLGLTTKNCWYTAWAMPTNNQQFFKLATMSTKKRKRISWEIVGFEEIISSNICFLIYQFYNKILLKAMMSWDISSDWRCDTLKSWPVQPENHKLLLIWRIQNFKYMYLQILKAFTAFVSLENDISYINIE